MFNPDTNLLISLIQLLFVVFSPFFYFALGRFVISTGSELLNKIAAFATIEIDSIHTINFFVIGLLFYLMSAFAIFSLNIPLGIAACLPLMPAFTNKHNLKIEFNLKKFKPSINFSIWFAVILTFGLSLFSAVPEITTPWVNNYGDLAFHLGIITSFVFGENSRPEYPIFAGQLLSYHFMINFWSACLWWLKPTYYSLSLIFMFQWVVVWLIAYWALNGEKFKILPWCLLFGGGSYSYVFGSINTLAKSVGEDKWAHQFITEGYPWTPFLTTIWVTQRPALLGIVVALTCLKLFHEFLNLRNSRVTLVLACLILSMSPLVHTTFFLTIFLYIIITLCLSFISKIKFTNQSRLADSLREPARDFIVAIISLAPLIFTIPWLLDKSSVMKFTWGWMPWPKTNLPLLSVINTSAMWLNNAELWIILIVLSFILLKNKTPITVLTCLFIFGNFIQLGVWNWDHIKYFICLYLLTLSILSHTQNSSKRALTLICGLMIIPALYESAKVIVNFRESVVYDKKSVELAQLIRENTPPNTIIAAAPKHNSPITLTGRRMFLGYGGTLGSHSIDYLPRKNFSKDLSNIINCKSIIQNSSSQIDQCPEYLLWTPLEATEWKEQSHLTKNLVSTIKNSFYSLAKK